MKSYAVHFKLKMGQGSRKEYYNSNSAYHLGNNWLHTGVYDILMNKWLKVEVSIITLFISSVCPIELLNFLALYIR